MSLCARFAFSPALAFRWNLVSMLLCRSVWHDRQPNSPAIPPHGWCTEHRMATPRTMYHAQRTTHKAPPTTPPPTTPPLTTLTTHYQPSTLNCTLHAARRTLHAARLTQVQASDRCCRDAGAARGRPGGASGGLARKALVPAPHQRGGKIRCRSGPHPPVARLRGQRVRCPAFPLPFSPSSPRFVTAAQHLVNDRTPSVRCVPCVGNQK
jgi:hypothetical protein